MPSIPECFSRGMGFLEFAPWQSSSLSVRTPSSRRIPNSNMRAFSICVTVPEPTSLDGRRSHEPSGCVRLRSVFAGWSRNFSETGYRKAKFKGWWKRNCSIPPRQNPNGEETMTWQNVIETRELTKRYGGSDAVHNLNL